MSVETIQRQEPYTGYHRVQSGMKYIAYGSWKYLMLYLAHSGQQPFTYYIYDKDPSPEMLAYLPIKQATALNDEDRQCCKLVLFGSLSENMNTDRKMMAGLGLIQGYDFILESDFLFDDFSVKASDYFGWQFNPLRYRQVAAYVMNSLTPNHTSILGTWLLLEILTHASDSDANYAEVGMWRGGNPLCLLNGLSSLDADYHPHLYLIDSFEGFSEPGQHDCQSIRKGQYNTSGIVEEIVSQFALYPEATIIRGFVPSAFTAIPDETRFSCVFYDADLYAPAVATFEYFWERIIPGGFLVVHDYIAERGGHTGIKKATDEFCIARGLSLISFHETTMAVIRKPDA